MPLAYRERILDSLELELQVVVNYPLGELKILFFYKNMPLALSFVHPVSRKLKKFLALSSLSNFCLINRKMNACTSGGANWEFSIPWSG